MEQRIQRKINYLLKKVEKLNDEILAYCKMTDTSILDLELPSVDCSFICFGSANLWTSTQRGNEIIFTDCDGYSHIVEVYTEDGEVYVDGLYELEENIKEERKRLNKAIRIWKSDDPDAD